MRAAELPELQARDGLDRIHILGHARLEDADCHEGLRVELEPGRCERPPDLGALAREGVLGGRERVRERDLALLV